jgi:hypothetical protein
VSGTDKGVLVVSDTGSVIEFSKEGNPMRHVNSVDAEWAAPVGSTGIAIASRSGELKLFDWSSREPRASYGVQQAGRPVAFKAIAALNPSLLIAFDDQAHELVWFDDELREQRRVPVDLTSPTIFLPLPGTDTLLVSGSESAEVRFVHGDGAVDVVKAPLAPVCADTVPGGGFVIGYAGKGAAMLVEPPFDDVEGRMARLTYDCLFAIVLYAAVGAWSFARLWILLTARLHRGRDGDQPLPPDTGEICSRTQPCGSALGVGAGVLAAYLGLAGAWSVYPLLVGSSSSFIPEFSLARSWGLFVLCCIVSGVSLVWLGRLVRAPTGPLSFSRPDPSFIGMNKIHWFLALLSCALAGVCNYRNVIELQPDYPNRSPKLIVACWIAAQVLIVMAVTRVRSQKLLPQWNNAEIWSVIGLCALTLFSRLLWIDHYPHNIHHDFGVMGEHVLRYLLEPWFPLFTLDAGQSSGRPWYMQMAGLMWLFGINDFALRLSNIIWSVGFVLAACLIGRETVSHRFGIIFGLLVAAQHNLLGYSRCPYVMESVAPFMFSLYFLSRGIRTMYAREFAVAGVWGAWSLMTIRNFTPYPFIGLVLLAFLTVLYPRRMWHLRWHLILMVVAGVIVFGPYAHFYLNEQHLTARLFESSPLLRDGQLSTDWQLWVTQFKRAFGGFLVYPDRISWEMESLVPVCAALTSGLFGAGLIILLCRMRSMGAAMALTVVIVDTTLGSALLEEPPSYYHIFVAIIFVMYVVGIPIECLWKVALGARFRIVRYALTACAASVALAAVTEESLPFIRYSMPSAIIHGVPQPKYNAHSLMARYTLQHRERRFIAVSRPGNNYEFQNATIRLFYGSFSERFELFSEVDDYLPVRPGRVNQDVSFFIDNFEDLNKVRGTYPQGVLESFPYAHGEYVIMVYTVSGVEVERAWTDESAHPDTRQLGRFSMAHS